MSSRLINTFFFVSFTLGLCERLLLNHINPALTRGHSSKGTGTGRASLLQKTARKYHHVREQLCSLTRVKIRMTPPVNPLQATPMVCFAAAVLSRKPAAYFMTKRNYTTQGE
jgi:hypothetical protein